MTFNLAVLVYAVQQRIGRLFNYADLLIVKLGDGIIVNELVTMASYFEIVL